MQRKSLLGMRSSKQEIDDLLRSWIAVSIAFTLVLSPGYAFESLLKFGIISAIVVGTGFLLHELAHKLVAQRFGCWAEFRANNGMLLMAILFAFGGFLFAAPGAVMIIGRVSGRENGIISFAGPLTNIILAVIMLPLAMFSKGILSEISFYGYLINTWIGLFNMVPFAMFDGAKILRWSKPAYFGLVISGLMLLFSRQII